MAEKIIGVEVKSLVYDIEDSRTRSIAEDALSNANSAVVKADETASALAPVAHRVAEIEANIGSNDISEIASNASAALEATEEIPPLQEKIGDVDISAAGDSVTDAISKMNEILGNVSGSVYSTEEKAVGKWIDGRMIYQKTISVGPLPNAGGKTVLMNIQNLREIISMEAMSGTASGVFVPVPYVTPSGYSDNITMYVYKDELRIITSDNRTSFINTYVTLKYTKTTG